MPEDLTVLLGCVSSEVSAAGPSSRPRLRERCLAQRVTLPRPPAGAHHAAVACKHCQQTVRIQVRSRRLAGRIRLSARLALAASVCLWAAATALVLLYFLEQYPASPGREAAVAATLVVLGAVLWAGADRQAAFAGEVVAGCAIERAPMETAWPKRVSPELAEALARHVLLDPEQESAPGLGAELVRAVRAALGNPGATSPAAAAPGAQDTHSLCPPAAPSSSEAPPPSHRPSTALSSRKPAAAA